MKRANKHSTTITSFAPLNGGINVSVPPDQIAENEMQDCTNFVYENAYICGRGGTKLLRNFGVAVKSMYYDYDVNCLFVFLENKEAYKAVIDSDGATVTYIGNVLGDNDVHCLRFQNKLFIASGDLLQYYDYDSNIQTITTSPQMDKLFYRWSRLGGFQIGKDNLYYSAVGDAIGSDSYNAWENDSNDASSAQFLEVGYADSGDIIDVVPLATDIIVLKSNGIAYQVVGDNDFDSVSIVTASTTTDITDDFGTGDIATNIGNEVVFVSMRGLRSLSATQDYGNIATSDIGDKFNPLLVNNQYEPEIWNLRRHKTIIIRPTDSHNDFVAYNYNLGAATKLHFPMNINWFTESTDEVLIGADEGLFVYRETELTDDGVAVDYSLITREVISTDEILVKSIDTDFDSDHSETVKVTVSTGLYVNMPTNTRRKVRCNHSCDSLHVELSSNDRFYVNHINLETVGL